MSNRELIDDLRRIGSEDGAYIEMLAAADALEAYERCLPVDDDFKVTGSHIGSIQNYTLALERTIERLMPDGSDFYEVVYDTWDTLD